MKKRILAMLLGAVMLVSFSACKSDDGKGESGKEEPVLKKVEAKEDSNELRTLSLKTGESRKTEYYSGTYDALLNVVYPTVNLNYGDEEKFPELEKALETDNGGRYEYAQKMLEGKDEIEKIYEDTGDFRPAHASEVHAFVRRADTNVTSILYSSYEYNGGAHGYGYRFGKTYDTKTGKLLKLSDVVKDKKKLLTAVKEQFEKFWSHIEVFDTTSIDEIVANEESLNWVLDYNGLTIYFETYLLASYADGEQVVNISYEEYPDVFKDKYKESPKAYGVELVSYNPFYYDVTGDGVIDKITYSSRAVDDYSTSAEISISVNDRELVTDEWFYDARATFVHTKDGGNYIYVEVSAENDYRHIICYEISEDIQQIGEVSGGLRSYYDDSKNLVTWDVLTNPESFYIQRITQHISTAQGYKEYAVGKDGVPASDDVMYKLENDIPVELTLLTELKADIYDEAKNKTNGKKTLKKGAKLLYVGTDNEKYGYLKCSDGTIIRVNAPRSEESYMPAINGVNIDEMFDGLFWAG